MEVKERMRRGKWRERGGGGECAEKRAMERRKRRREREEREERRTNPTQVSLEAAGRTTEGQQRPPVDSLPGADSLDLHWFGYKTVQEEIRSSLDSSYLHVKYTTFSVLLNTAEHAFV